MKKIVVLILAFVLIFSTFTFAGVEELNLAEMSIEELLELRSVLNDELLKRMGTGDVIFSGTYKVGRDIKAGSYLFTCSKDDPEYSSYDIDICYYANEEDYNSRSGIMLGDFQFRKYIKYQESAIINLEDGGYLYVLSGEANVTPYKASWMVE